MEVAKTLLMTTYKRTRHLKRRSGRKTSVVVPVCMLAVAFLCALGVSGGSRNLVSQSVEAQAGVEEVQAEAAAQTEELQAGLKGVMSSAVSIEKYSRAAEEIDMSGANEEILVGAAKVSRQENIRSTLEQGTKSAATVVASARQLVRETQMPESEYYTLLRIVEAEATGEDLEGKMLIANVILNRVKDERFPDTIEEVVWQEIGGAAQFQPTVDGRIYTVEITEETIEAVDRVLAGADSSQGALYFMARSASDDTSVGWFDDTLIPLFEHGGHEYYTLSEDATVS